MNKAFSLFACALRLAASMAILTVAMPTLVLAQETTSSIRGSVTGPDGTPTADATINITDMRTGSNRSATTSASGQFTASGLRVGGPYTVTISAEGYADQSITDIQLGLGDTYTFNVALSSDSIEEIVVTASALRSVQVAMGPSATFSLADLQDSPSINRNINDVIGMDPRVYIDEG
ncbi:MAG: carboxypeptidase regulatory-like domain-containing protein, partial [Halioglobus sp.]|nr:carboxypeptidase regulatory-like domain-containing protein [Halioglobus sp.]